MRPTENDITGYGPDEPSEFDAAYWQEQLDHATALFNTWQDRGRKVVERFRDERDATGRLTSKFNILWSNIQVLAPSLYGRPAKPEVSRRYFDADPVGRLASTMLERALEYEVAQFPDFDAAMASSVEDRLLPGRGTVWLRLEPTFTPEAVSTAPIEGVQVTSSEELVTVENITAAHSPVDYVYWKDFLHSPARTWDEVWWVSRWVYMTEEEGCDRFGEIFLDVPLNEYKEDNAKKPKDRAEQSSFAEKAKVAEIWNKRTGRVIWMAHGYPEILDEAEDPLHLEGFFPCPKPLYATTTNGSLIPVPDYCEYEDQARELDSITGRITKLVKAVKANGVYNGEFKTLTRLLNESTDNTLLPVDNWGALAEKGGLKGAVDMLDISTQIQALGALYAAREAVKQTIYEICGISDILRGTTKAEETLGAQQLKANFGSLRLKKSQTDVARFASDIFRLKAQIICRFYPSELIVKMSGIEQTDDGKDPERLQAALAMLTEGPIRDFHISVESDSLAQIDDEAEKVAATECVTAIGGFLEKALPVAQEAPATLPMISEMMLFTLRRYRAGRNLESAVEQSMKLIQQQASQPKGPTPEQMEMQMQQQADQARIAADTQAAAMKEQFAAQAQTQKLAAEGQLEQMKAQMDQQSEAFKAQLELEQLDKTQQFELAKTQMELASKETIADRDNAVKLQIAEMQLHAKQQEQAVAATVDMSMQDKEHEHQAETQASEQAHTAESQESEQAHATETQSAEHEAQASQAEAAAEPEAPQPFALNDPNRKESPAVEVHVEAPAQEPAPSVAEEAPKKPKRWTIKRDEKGRMSELVAAED